MATFNGLPVELKLRIVQHVNTHDATYREHLAESPVVAPKNIDYLFWRLTLARYEDLRHVALTCHDLRPLAQETLFRTIAVDNSVRDHGQRHTGIHRLLTTLLQRPDLASKARFLHLDIGPYNLPHVTTNKRWPLPTEICDVDNCHLRVLQRLCKSLVNGLDMRLWLCDMIPRPATPRSLRYQFYINWLEALELHHNEYFLLPQIWAAVAAILPHVLPNLKTISMNAQENDHDAFYYCFGEPNLFPPTLVQGFSCITMIQTTFVPAWCVLSVPTLNTVHLDLSDARTWYECDEFGASHYVIDDGNSCENIKYLLLELSIAALETWEGDGAVRHNTGIYQTTKKLLGRLGGLKGLRIHCCYRKDIDWHIYEDMYWESLGIGYGELREFLINSSVENVTIDTAEVNWHQYQKSIADCTDSHSWRFQADSIESFHTSTTESSLPLLPNLRRLICPQEALLRHYLDSDFHWSPYPLPGVLEVVEIIDSTRILNHWARYVLEHPAEYPNLKKIVLWCDRLSVPLSSDGRLRQRAEFINALPDAGSEQPTTRDSGDDVSDSEDGGIDDDEGNSENQSEDDGDAESDTEMEEMIPEDYKLDDEGDEAWEQLQEAGIEVVVYFKQDRGWRDG
jgi:hypothetical protein